MQIAIRSPEILRSLTSRFDYYVTDWPHHKRLLALASMLGYASWEALVASASPKNQPFTFDQDLPNDEARQQRWLWMAENLTASLNVALPEALDIVHSILPTAEFSRRAEMIWYQPNNVFNDALARDQNLWWVSTTYGEHPLAPPGFSISIATNVADVARLRVDTFNDYAHHRALPILCPLKPKIGRHRYLRREELVVIEPVSITLTPAQRAALKQLAGSSHSPRKRGIYGIQAREAIGQPWYWPLVLKEPGSTAASQAAKHAKAVDEVLEADGRIDLGDHVLERAPKAARLRRSRVA